MNENFMENIAQWLSGGWPAIALGLVGLGGFGVFFRTIAKQRRERAYKNELDKASSEVADASINHAKSMEDGEKFLDKKVDSDRAWIKSRIEAENANTNRDSN